MQIFGSISSNEVLGTSPEPVEGTTLVNGKYILYTPEGVSVGVSSTSYFLPQNASSIPGLIAQGLLDRNPAFDNVVYNFFLEASDALKLDFTSGAPLPTSGNVVSGTLPTLAPDPLGARFQAGRGVGPAPVGSLANSAALLPATLKRASPAYGSLVTPLVDVTSFNPLNPGTDEVLIWWKVGRMTTSEDIVQGYNSTLNQNSPSIKNLEISPPGSVLCYASIDNGVTWVQVKYMTPTALAASGINLRVALINEGPEKLYLLGLVILFPNLP